MEDFMICLLLGVLASLAVALVQRRRIRHRRTRRYWVQPWIRRRDQASQQTMLDLYRELIIDGDVQEFQATLRMSPDVYAGLLAVLRSGLTKQHTNFRAPISPETRLAVTLRYLALGDSFRSISQQFRIGLSTCRIIIRDTCQVIIGMLQARYMSTPRTRQEWLKIAHDFNVSWNFPHCLGVIDSKHIWIVQPYNSGSYFFNYKGYYSTVLMAIAYSDYRFLYIDCGAEGKASDGGIWSKCSFNAFLRDPNNPLNIPDSAPLEGCERDIPYCLLGDDAFRLNAHLMKPYPGTRLSERELIFNYRLSQARRIIENTFGILTCRFRIFRRTIEVAPDFVDDIVMSSCVLHNYLRDQARNDYLPAIAIDNELNDGTIAPGAWRQENSLDPLQRDTLKNAGEHAKQIRSDLSYYFLSKEGEVIWQYERIGQ